MRTSKNELPIVLEALTYLQAHHMDLAFYDRFFKESVGYLHTHWRHMARWHPDRANKMYVVSFRC